MRRTLKTLPPCLVAFLLMLTVAFAGNAQELQKKLEGLKGVQRHREVGIGPLCREIPRTHHPACRP